MGIRSVISSQAGEVNGLAILIILFLISTMFISYFQISKAHKNLWAFYHNSRCSQSFQKEIADYISRMKNLNMSIRTAKVLKISPKTRAAGEVLERASIFLQKTLHARAFLMGQTLSECSKTKIVNLILPYSKKKQLYSVSRDVHKIAIMTKKSNRFHFISSINPSSQIRFTLNFNKHKRGGYPLSRIAVSPKKVLPVWSSLFGDLLSLQY